MAPGTLGARNSSTARRAVAGTLINFRFGKRTSSAALPPMIQDPRDMHDTIRCGLRQHAQRQIVILTPLHPDAETA